jgi:Arc/MetJ-type ribon-helix-helix transcriptional regulator
MEDSDLEKVTLRLPERYIRALDFLVEADDFPSRSEAIRAAIRDFIYARVELVQDKIKKMEEAERTLASIESFEERYLKK